MVTLMTNTNRYIALFRGAVNALELVLASDQTTIRPKYFLTQTFRLVSEIAITVKTCLQGL